MALSKQKTLKGTVLKMAVNFECPSNNEATLEKINFFSEWYCTSKRLKIEKAQHVFEDGQCYAYVDTGKIGTGALKMRIWADIPDPDSPMGIRVEYAEVSTDVVIS